MRGEARPFQAVENGEPGRCAAPPSREIACRKGFLACDRLAGRSRDDGEGERERERERARPWSALRIASAQGDGRRVFSETWAELGCKKSTGHQAIRAVCRRRRAVNLSCRTRRTSSVTPLAPWLPHEKPSNERISPVRRFGNLKHFHRSAPRPPRCLQSVPARPASAVARPM
jgi:hypothetical protein